MGSETVQLRARRSFFAGHCNWSKGGVGVCRGLSCVLNGAAAIAGSAPDGPQAATVYCLGFCDRSPAVLLPDGSVLAGAAALRWSGSAREPEAEPETRIRCIARRAVVTERLAQGSHATLTAARRAGVYQALAKALRDGSPETLLRVVEASGEQGRGGAGYPTGLKWRGCAHTDSRLRYVIANGDEGDPGSFVDRMLLEDDPHAVLEGLMLCARAVGAREGVIFIRGEYPRAQAVMTQAIVEAREAGLLGPAVMGYDFSFDARVVSGEGSYVCGEETALLNAIEGRRGEVRVRPPYPSEIGLYGKPTVINNIETLVNIPWIVREGAETYRRLGTAGSPGTKAFCLNRGFRYPGIVEAEFGINLRELVEVHGGGVSDESGLRAVVLGGPMGSVLTPAEYDVIVDYDALRHAGVRLGHGGIVAIPASADPLLVLRNWVEFMSAESCGKCVPCSLGSRRSLELVRGVANGRAADRAILGELEALMNTVEAASLCGFGRGIAGPIKTLGRLAISDGAAVTADG